MKNFFLPNTVRNTFGLISSRYVQVGMRALLLLIAARMLGQEVYGQLNYSQSWYMMFYQFATLGLQSIISIEVGRQSPRINQTISDATSAVLICSSLLSILSCGIVLWLESNAVIRNATILFSCAIFSRGLAVWIEMLLVAHEKGGKALLMTMVVRPFEPVMAILLILFGFKIVALAALHTISWGVQAIVGYLILKKNINLPKLTFQYRLFLRLMRLGLPLMVAGAAMGFLQFGLILTHRWLGGESLGVLSILIQVVAFLGIVPLSLMQTLLPKLSRKMAIDKNRTRMILLTMAAIFHILVILLITIVHPFSKFFVQLVLGQEYILTAHSLWLALLMLGMYGTGLALNQWLILNGQYYKVLISTCSGVLVLLFLRSKLFPFYSIFQKDPSGTMFCGLCGYFSWIIVGSVLGDIFIDLLKLIVFSTIVILILYYIDTITAVLLIWVLVGFFLWQTNLFKDFKSILANKHNW